jgi:TPR repeat protein
LTYLYDHPGVVRDIDQALVWMRKAADQGDIRSEITLANLYSIGMHVPKDAAQALAWYVKAAEQGDVWSQNHLGTAYSMGTLVPKDDIRAVYWFRKAAERGDGQAPPNWPSVLPMPKAKVCRKAKRRRSIGFARRQNMTGSSKRWPPDL